MLGYGSSSPASASLFIYNPTTSSMVTSYIAPSPGSTPAITSLPAPTQTGSQPKSNGGTGTTPGGSSGTPSNSSDSSGSSNHTTAIALGTTFGVLGLIAGVLATIYYKRRRDRDRSTTGRFFPLADDPEFSSLSGSVGGVALEAAHLEGRTNARDKRVMITDILAHLGISKFRSRPRQPRKDMFVDEDSRSFGHSSTVRRQDSEGMSTWSLRSVGALVRSAIGLEPSGSGVDQGDHERKTNGHLRDAVQEGLIRHGSLHSDYSSPTHQKDGSSWSYTDPFEDPIPDDEYDLHLCLDVPEKDADYDHSVLRSDDFELTALGPQDSVWPPLHALARSPP